MQVKSIPTLFLLTACPPNKADTALDPRCNLPSIDEYPDSWPNYRVYPANFAWQESPLLPAFDINPSSFETNAGISASDVLVDFNSMASIWSGTGANFAIRVGSEASTSEAIDLNPDDDVFEVAMAETAPDDGTGLATTMATWQVPPCLTSCDTVVWSKDKSGTPLNWSANRAPYFNEYGLLTTLVHEMGHCIGLDDQTTFTGATIMDEQFQEEDFKSLPTTDVEVVKYLYGTP